ncbi:MAG TPA: hypothetical protein PLV61_16095 [Parvularculaceae bacterium]|nr:hypothetical protein [Parvularculaceae bacterium]
MILRRVIEHVRKQHWTAVFLDFVIVVVGVFIGIQVSNWNAAQMDARRGEEYAERLATDLKYDLEGRRSLVAYFDEVNKSLENSIVLLADPNSDPRELVVNVYRSTEFAHNPQTRATWDEIVSAGELGLMPRDAVEGGISFYFGSDISEQTASDVTSSPLRRRVRSILSHNVQKAIRAGCSDIRDGRNAVVSFVDECRIDAPDADIFAAAEELRRDPELVRDLQLHASAMNTARANLRGEVIVLEAGIASLEDSGKKARK